jgi:diacylglycerol kinase family enzyme
MPDKILIFANPIAGRGKGKVIARRLERELTDAGFTVATFFDRPGDLTLQRAGDDAHTVVSIGGDGTLRGVVNLFFSHGHDGPPVLPVPMGTANLMGRHLGIHWPERGLTRAVIQTIRRRQVIRLDAGRANGRLFLLMAGVGIDGHIVHLLDRMRRGPIDKISYLLPAAMTFAMYTFPPITVRVDGRTVLDRIPATVLIGNVREYGIGFSILTEAVPNDGLLDVCILPCRDRGELVEILMQIALGEHASRESVIYMRGKTVFVDSEKPLAVQLDGDSAGFTPLSVDLLPARVPFLMAVGGNAE